ncbi:MAG: vitamin B12 transporter BtuB [Alphaproteobacteria bacterium]|nr:MAG: vitamin B12 transporter BtuB [Alphaproteobacteria bacterium]
MALMLAAGHAQPALAQDANNGDDAEIVVTATRTQTSVERIAARVDVVTRAEMENRNYVTAVDALAQTPGLNVVQSGGAGAITSMFSRGTNSKHTLALFDGIRLNDASAPNGQYNFGQDTVSGLERIEVVRGAASSVYGSDAIGGVINFIPRVGGDRPIAPFFEIGAGSRESYRLSAGAVGSAGPISYAVTGEHYETAGFNNVADRFPDNLGEDDTASFDTITGVADFSFTDNITLRGLVRWRQSEADFDDSALDRIGRTGDDEYFVWRLGPRLSLFGDLYETELNVGEVRNERTSRDAADVNQSFPAPSSEAEGVRSFANWRNTLNLGSAGALHDVVLSGGVEWQREDIDVSGGYSDPLSRAEDALGIYAMARARLAGRVDLSASVRRDDNDNFDEATTWNIGAVLQLPEIGARLYASTGSSFKAPTLNERYGSSAYTIPNPDLAPEEGESWEVGFDYRPLSSVTFGATYFSSEIENLIEYVTVDPITFAGENRNVGVAEIDGYEAFIDLAPLDMLRLRVNYTYTDARNGLTGAELLRRPPHAWSAALELTPVEPLVLTLSYLNRGDRMDVLYSNTNPWGLGGGYVGNGPAEGYQVFNLAGRFQLNDNISLVSSVSNLTDERYEDPNAYRGQPRTFWFGVRGSF